MIEKIKRAYLFEADEEWIEALEATFTPWREKITIVNKFVSDKNDPGTCSLNSFFEYGQTPDFLKVDVDGAEAQLLKGGNRLLSGNQLLQVALCTYHKQEDFDLFQSLLQRKGFQTASSKGFMIFLYDTKPLTPPYLRRVLIRASKKHQSDCILLR